MEQAHIAAAFRFELSKVTVPAIRERTVSMLRNASEELAQKVASGLGMESMPAAMPKALENPETPEVDVSPALSLTARQGDGSIKARKIAILVAPGVKMESCLTIHDALIAQGAVPRFVGPHIGKIATAEGGSIDADASMENSPGFLLDALVLPSGSAAVAALQKDGHTMEFIKDQFRHCKPMLVLQDSVPLLENAGIDCSGDTAAIGLFMADTNGLANAVPKFLQGIGMHRYPMRETDPPLV